jgi:hypothetical protein
LYQLPPFVGQFAVGAATSASPLNAGAFSAFGRDCACAADVAAASSSATVAPPIVRVVIVIASSPRSQSSSATISSCL